MPTMPVKTRELRNHHMDSAIWNDFAFRDDDIVIATYAKSGTTWTQQIVGQLLSGGDPSISIADRSPWVDMRIAGRDVLLPMLEAQQGRRFLKTHLPVDALVMSPRAKYLYIARDGRDVAWSLHNHYRAFTHAAMALINDTPGRVGPPLPPAPADVRDFWQAWFANDGQPFWSFWENVRSWWAVRHLPNVLMLHFADLKRDLPGEIARIAEFLEIEADAATLTRVVEHCSFDWMRARGDTVVPLAGAIWENGADSFLNKGTNGRWQGVLSAGECAAYEGRALAELGPKCAGWLASGSAGALPLAA
jgi:aryl sulfotransferase